MITFIEIPLGTGSACSCARCGALPTREFTSAEVIGARVGGAVAEWTDGPGPNVLLTGPEPFSHPELPQIVSGAASAGVERIGLRTDAGALSLPGNAEGVLAAGVHHLQVVLLGGDSATHDELAGRRGLFDAAMEGVGVFVSAARATGRHVAVTGLIPACKHNLANLPATVAALASADAVCVTIAPAPSAVEARGFAEWVGAAIDTGLVNGVWVTVTGLEGSEVPRSALHGVSPFTLAGAAS